MRQAQHTSAPVGTEIEMQSLKIEFGTSEDVYQNITVGNELLIIRV